MITDLISLRDAVVDYYDHAQVLGNWGVILQNAEARLSNDVLTRDIELSQYGKISDPVLPIPDDVNAYQRLVLYRDGSQEYSLEYAPPGTHERYTGAVGRPISYTVLDQSLILYPSPDQEYEYALYYMPRIRPLTTENPSNEVLTRAPQMYLYACLAECALYLRTPDLMGFYLKSYDNAWRNYESAVNRAKYPLSTPLRGIIRSAV